MNEMQPLAGSGEIFMLIGRDNTTALVIAGGNFVTPN